MSAMLQSKMQSGTVSRIGQRSGMSLPRPQPTPRRNVSPPTHVHPTFPMWLSILHFLGCNNAGLRPSAAREVVPRYDERAE